MFRIKYVNQDRIDTTNSATSVLGRAFHASMEVYWGGHPDIQPKDEQDAIKQGLVYGTRFVDEYPDGFVEFTKTIPNKQKIFDLFSFSFTSYVKELPWDPNEEVIATEELIELSIDVEWRGKTVTLPIPLKGYIDKVVRIDGKIKVKDYKCTAMFSNFERIDGSKMIQAIQYYFLIYAKYGEPPYSCIFEEVKNTKNRDGSPQVRQYEIVYEENELYFDFYFRLYSDVTRALNGEMVWVPNVGAFYDNELAIISYIHRLDEPEEKAKLMAELKVESVSELLKKQIQNAGNMRKFFETAEQKFVSAKSLNYEGMEQHEKIQTKLMEHGMLMQYEKKIEGATVDLYCYTPSIGLKMARIKSFAADVEQVLGVSGIRVLAPILNSTMVGFEVPRQERSFKKLLAGNKDFNLAIGEDIMGNVRRYDIREAPHMIISGAAGSGKSVFLNTLITQLLELRNTELHLFDPKQVELFQFEGKKGVVEYRSAHEEISDSLNLLVDEMEKRYTFMKGIGVRNIRETKLKYKFLVIDEFADLIIREKGEFAKNIQILAQKGRACGIHLIIATQRASTKIISGDTKVNFPIKAVFRMSKASDSHVMIDEEGAEKLLGKGDMLFATEQGIERLQAYYI